MRGATHWPHGLLLQQPRISIHAPHARSDSGEPPPTWAPYFISIHAPHARSDTSGGTRSTTHFQFQSTLLMRGATCASTCSASPIRVFQSTLLMRGATKSSRAARRALKISIHAPHARSDKLIVGAPAAFSIFQSTLLMRGATVTTADIEAAIKISIHAPHARSDLAI